MASVGEDHLVWRRVTVDGRIARYGMGGSDGPPVLFLHGWALGSRAYKRAVRRLISRGCRVYAPAMPSFGGTADLPNGSMTIAHYAAWISAFMDEVGIAEPALVIGHSFGGGVAVQLAHTRPDRVRYLVLVNAVGGVDTRSACEWFTGFARELWPIPQAVEMARAMQADLVPNLIRNPIGLARAGILARDADLGAELAALRAHGVPVLVLTSAGDGVIPRAAFDALCSAVGADGRVVSGRHCWLLADPDSFDQVLANVVDVQVSEYHTASAATRAQEVASLLDGTKISNRTIRTLVRDAPPIWLMSDSPHSLAGDLALCLPRLRRREIRAVARRVDESDAVRLTIVAEDRPGLLADSAAILAWNHLSITDASAATWTGRKLALHSFVVEGATLDDDAWSALGSDLRSMVANGTSLKPPLRRNGDIRVAVDGVDGDRVVVRVRARDQIGLLTAICRWFAQTGANIESVRARTANGTVDDTFLVIGSCDAGALRRHLQGR